MRSLEQIDSEIKRHHSQIINERLSLVTHRFALRRCNELLDERLTVMKCRHVASKKNKALTEK